MGPDIAKRRQMTSYCVKQFSEVSHIIRKPVYAICEQQRRRSAFASVQSYQHLCFHCIDSIISLLAIAEISRSLLVSSAEQASLSITWSEPLKIGFLVTRLEWSLSFTGWGLFHPYWLDESISNLGISVVLFHFYFTGIEIALSK